MPGNATVIPVGALAMSTRRTVFLQMPALTKMLYTELANTEMGGWIITGKKLEK